MHNVLVNILCNIRICVFVMLKNSCIMLCVMSYILLNYIIIAVCVILKYWWYVYNLKHFNSDNLY